MTTNIDWGRKLFGRAKGETRASSLRRGATVGSSSGGYVSVLLDGSDEPVTLACVGYLESGAAVTVVNDGGTYKIIGDGGFSGGSGVGYTFYPTVSESGVISWENDGGLKNPEPVNIKGDPGVYYGSEKPTGSPPPVWIDPNGVNSGDVNMPDFITEETDPTVPAWAKQPNKPTYTASEVGADTKGSASSALDSANAYTNQKLATHNEATDAHADIRQAAANAYSIANNTRALAGDAYNLGIAARDRLDAMPTVVNVNEAIAAHNADTASHDDIRQAAANAYSIANNTRALAGDAYNLGTAARDRLDAMATENWTFTLEDGSTVTKAVYIG